MKLRYQIIVDKLPKNCLDCCFNQNKYCSAKMCMDEKTRGSTFVQNNRDKRDDKCPLTDIDDFEDDLK